MSDPQLKPPADATKAPLKPPAVAALSTNSLQLPSSAVQQLTIGSNSTTSGSATGNPRNKCALKPGYSLMSWIRLCNSGADLSGTGGRVVPVSRTELAQHNKVNDAWMAIRGRVFNVTRYIDFHPGGVDELMRGVGRDATKLFDEVHAWVNYPQLLGKCYVGPLKENVAIKLEKDIIRPPPAPAELVPRFDWIQQCSELTLFFYTRRMANPGLLLQRKEVAEALELRIQLSNSWHVFNFKLNSAIVWPPKAVRVSAETGKIEVVLCKQIPEPWPTYGSMESSKLNPSCDEHYEYEVMHSTPFNHDSFELCLQSMRRAVLMYPPVGYHLDIEVPHNGESHERSYTPVPHMFTPSNTDRMNADSPIDMCQSFLIKHYANGIVSSQLKKLGAGDTVRISLPRGGFTFAPMEAHRNILLLAAGSGITPILSLLQPLLKRQTNRIERLQLLFFNKTQSDKWLEDKLQALQDIDERFNCKHILTEGSQPSGRISQEMLAPFFGKETFSYVAACGPTGFNAAALDCLKELHLKPEQIHIFQG